MPDTLSLTTSVSLGLLAGIVSGVCYLVANGLTWPKNDQEYHKRCLTSSTDDGVCRRCGGDKQGGLVPCICGPHSAAKFESGESLIRKVQQAISLMPWSISTDKLEQIDEECDDCAGPSDKKREDLRNIRAFLEALSAKLAGGQLEGTRVAPLYDHPAYLSMFERHHAALRNALTALATALRDALTPVKENFEGTYPRVLQIMSLKSSTRT